MSGLTITPIPAFTDNYLWLLERDGEAVVVDPGDAAPVRRVLQDRGLSLRAVLITHWHPDHIGGLAALKAEFEVPVYGPLAEAARIPELTRSLVEGDQVAVLDRVFAVWETPGHTLGHIAYVSLDSAASAAGGTAGLLLCGDTLFSAGCGRLFEGSAAQLYQSLARFLSLADKTLVYCTHEYTLDNLAFAAAVEPENMAVREKIASVRGLRGRNLPSLPSRLGDERLINPFLRVHEPAVVRAAERQAGRRLEAPVDVFAALRRWKDGFRVPADF